MENKVKQIRRQNSKGLLILIVCYFPFFIHAQDTLDLSKYKDEAGWYNLPNDSPLIFRDDFFSSHASQLGLTGDDQMVQTKLETDENGNEHARYQQYYKGYLIEGADFSLHGNSGIVQIAHGRVVSNLNTDITVGMQESDALNSALISINAKVYAWQDQKYRKDMLSEGIPDPTTDLYPHGTLIIASPNNIWDGNSSNYGLVWKFSISATEPHTTWSVYVNAQNGQIVKSIENSASCGHQGTAVTSYYDGNRSITTDYMFWGFILFS